MSLKKGIDVNKLKYNSFISKIIKEIYSLFRMFSKFRYHVLRYFTNLLVFLVRLLCFIIRQFVFPWLAVNNIRKSFRCIVRYGFSGFFTKCKRKIISGSANTQSGNLAISAMFSLIFRELFLSQAISRNLKLSIFYIKKYGFKSFLLKFRQRVNDEVANKHTVYWLWINKNEPNNKELREQRRIKFKCKPLISIITPVFNTPKQMLIDMIESVRNQTYTNWELCIVDGGSKNAYIRCILDEYASKDMRIKVKYLSENKGIAGNSNEAISFATGSFVGFLDHDDIIAPFALFEIVKVINDNPDVDFLYSDEDKISSNGEWRYAPFFKPDFSPDTLRSYNYICHFLVFEKKLGETVNWLRSGYEGAQDHDLILRLSEKAKKIIHIPKILYHWRVHQNSTAMDPTVKKYFLESGEKCINEHLIRIGLVGSVKHCGLLNGFYKTILKLSRSPLVSIIIPNKDHPDVLRKCILSILNNTTYINFEIIIIENFSVEAETFKLYRELGKFKNIRIIEWKYEFNFSRLNNFAVKQSNGEIILFLNNDTEIINSDWLERMVEHAVRKDVGAVGAKLYYPDNTIQHAGVIIGIGGFVGHAHKNFHMEDGGYANRLRIVQNFSCVTAACLMSRRDVIEEVGGFNEALAVAVNDVDFCLKIREKGYLIVWTPYAELYHHESKTRGLENTNEKKSRFSKEKGIFLSRWGSIINNGDPYYNVNLTLDSEDFKIKI